MCKNTNYYQSQQIFNFYGVVGGAASCGLVM